MDMKKYLPSVDLEKLSKILEIKEAYQRGDISLEEGRAQIRSQVGKIRPYEIALAEQELKTIEENECQKEDIQKMIELFDEVMDTSRPNLPLDHPIMCYYRENDEMRRLMLSIEDLVQYPIIKNQWIELYDQIAAFRTHLSRKQNQLYSILEQKGFDRPTTTMWLLDDFVRDEIRDAKKLIEEDKEEEFLAMQPTIVADVRDLLQKEESVLYPTALAMITPEEFEQMRSGDYEIGFAWIDVEGFQNADKTVTPSTTVPDGFVSEQSALLAKYELGGNDTDRVFDVTTGKLSLEQINLIYKHLPVDISYVDENELVRFYSDTNHRIFPRSKNVIGRDVKNCHPRTSVHLVEEIIAKFRSGEQDSVDFWINKPDVFIYIYYVAVRDAEGRFRGVLEMMQDCSRIRELQGSRTLLTWSNDTQVVKSKEAQNCTPNDTSVTKEDSTIELSADTRLQDLLKIYPQLRKDLPSMNSAFKMLNSPLARIIIPKATIAMMSKRSGVPLDDILSTLKELIAKYKREK
ncbi:MAG: PAS domain-containing protein [Prevotella sp.]|nr:PAS domain-containing protein [Prevotella sp.]